MSEIKTITSLATETEITFSDFWQFAWVKNLGENDCYLSNKSGIVAGAADVALIKAGESGLIITETDTIYSKGATTLEIHAQNFAEAPFKSTSTGSGGGSITIDDVPTQGSTNAVSSGGTYTAIQAVKRTTTTLWTNAGSDATITLSDDYDNYDELIFYGSYTYNSADYKTFGVIYTDGVSVGDHIQPLSNNSGGTEYTVSSKTELTNKAAIGFMWNYDKVVGVKYGA